jgi:hypothetical protein
MFQIEAAATGDKRFPFSIMGTGIERASVEAKALRTGSAGDAATRGLRLNGCQLMFGCAVLLGTVQLLLWAVLRLWLFQP